MHIQKPTLLTNVLGGFVSASAKVECIAANAEEVVERRPLFDDTSDGFAGFDGKFGGLCIYNKFDFDISYSNMCE